MQKRQLLARVAKDIEACAQCKIGKSGKAVPGEGSSDAHVVFIGEAPGKQEALTGRPFIGRSGVLLRTLIQDIGLIESEVFITSPVKYLPDKGTPTSDDIAHGRIHLMEQLSIINPRMIVLLGRVAAEGVLQKKIAVMSTRGTVITQGDKQYFLTIHPAAAVRFQKFKKHISEDFKTLQKLLEI